MATALNPPFDPRRPQSAPIRTQVNHPAARKQRPVHCKFSAGPASAFRLGLGGQFEDLSNLGVAGDRPWVARHPGGVDCPLGEPREAFGADLDGAKATRHVEPGDKRIEHLSGILAWITHRGSDECLALGVSEPLPLGRDTFIEGMFRKEQGLALPERARRALEALAEAGGLLRGVSEVARDPAKPASANDIAQTRRHISELTAICEREIHAALLSCTRARRRMPNSVPNTKPTLH
jgi:hypothetical protein